MSSEDIQMASEIFGSPEEESEEKYRERKRQFFETAMAGE